MVRHRFHVVFALGKFNDGVKWVRDLNEASRKVGCVEGKLWAMGFGKVNECVIEYDYPDMATMDADVDRFQSATETMAVFRRGLEVGATEHWPWDELLQEAPTLA
jgi:hypothetical protein